MATFFGVAGFETVPSTDSFEYEACTPSFRIEVLSVSIASALLGVVEVVDGKVLRVISNAERSSN